MDDKERGVRATSREFARYDQVDKPHEYHLAEGADEGAFDEEYQVRGCDLGQFLRGGDEGKRRFSVELGEALQDLDTVGDPEDRRKGRSFTHELLPWFWNLVRGDFAGRLRGRGQYRQR
jgi:hypothetical protein